MARSGPGSLLPTCLTFPEHSVLLPLMVFRQPLVAGAALTVRSLDQAPPPGRLPGPGSNVSALAGRGRLARMPGWAALPETGALEFSALQASPRDVGGRIWELRPVDAH